MSTTQPPSGELRKAIIASVVASVFALLVIQPAMRGIYSLLVATGSIYVDSLYKSAALGHRNYVEVMLLLGGYSFALGIVTGRRLASWVGWRGSIQRRRLVLTVWYAGLAISFVALGAIVTQTFIDLQLNTSFEQRLTVLSPVLSHQEEKRLRAEWASMRDRADYLEIRREMDALAQARGVTLPPPLLR